VRVRVDAAAAVASSWWGCHLACDDDYRFSGAFAEPHASGYTIAVTSDGSLVVSARSPSGTEELARVTARPLPVGSPGLLRVRVTPTSLHMVWNASAGHPTELMIRDARSRGPYVFLGRYADGPAVSFADVRVTDGSIHGAPDDG
jgi:hypothetical protein